MRLDVRTKLLVFAALVWLIIFGFYGVYVYKERIEQTRRMALTTAGYLSRETLVNRQIYTSIVVKRAIDAGLTVESGYESHPKSLPVPSAFTRDVSKALSTKGGFQINIVSLAPVGRSVAPLDEFQKKALERLYGGEDTRHYAFGKYNGKESVRYMVPDLATSQACVDCHNRSQTGALKNLKIGDIMGGVEIIVPMENELEMAVLDAWRSIGYGFAVVLVMGIAGLVFIRRVVTTPIRSLVETTTHLAAGNLTVRSAVKSRDEIGDLGSSTNDVVSNLHRVIEDIRAVADDVLNVSSSINGLSRDLLDGAGSQDSSLDSLGKSASEMNLSVAEIAKSAEDMTECVESGVDAIRSLLASVSEAVGDVEALFEGNERASESIKEMGAPARELSDRVESLKATAVKGLELLANIGERAGELEAGANGAARSLAQLSEEARSCSLAIETAVGMGRRLGALTREASGMIGGVSTRVTEAGRTLDVIKESAEELNMLALNAAIIAAQSGEYGNSFSVVASEMKELAERVSASATEVFDAMEVAQIEAARAHKVVLASLEGADAGLTLSQEAGERLKRVVSMAQLRDEASRDMLRLYEAHGAETSYAAETLKRASEMSHRLAGVVSEHAKSIALMEDVIAKTAQIAMKLGASSNAQKGWGAQINEAMEQFSLIAGRITVAVREQGRAAQRAASSVDAIRAVSLHSIHLANEMDLAVGELARLSRALRDNVVRFRLK